MSSTNRDASGVATLVITAKDAPAVREAVETLVTLVVDHTTDFDISIDLIDVEDPNEEDTVD